MTTMILPSQVKVGDKIRLYPELGEDDLSIIVSRIKNDDDFDPGYCMFWYEDPINKWETSIGLGSKHKVELISTRVELSVADLDQLKLIKMFVA